MNNRNRVRQEIILANGTKKVIWHEKKFNAPQYADYKQAWKAANMTAKPNSKRQKALRAEKLTILEEAA